MTNITLEEIGHALLPYGPVSTVTCSQIKTYIELLIQWNQKISLTTIIDPIQIVNSHFGESIFAASAVPMTGGRLADVGTGPGFPGIPLRMVVSDLDVTLIEPIAKKTAFLSEVVRKLEIGTTRVIRIRMESLVDVKPFDFITARALGHYEELLQWASVNLSDSGHVVLWLGESDAKAVSLISAWRWREPILIPNSERRYLLVGRRMI
jgi:16S rRNA (guanine527-N7)-methyltransferase